jgi:hypothetical protein
MLVQVRDLRTGEREEKGGIQGRKGMMSHLFMGSSIRAAKYGYSSM